MSWLILVQKCQALFCVTHTAYRIFWIESYLFSPPPPHHTCLADRTWSPTGPRDMVAGCGGPWRPSWRADHGGHLPRPPCVGTPGRRFSDQRAPPPPPTMSHLLIMAGKATKNFFCRSPSFSVPLYLFSDMVFEGRGAWPREKKSKQHNQ